MPLLIRSKKDDEVSTCRGGEMEGEGTAIRIGVEPRSAFAGVLTNLTSWWRFVGKVAKLPELGSYYVLIRSV